MNYYIQGDAAKADKIKAAFESKGYDVWRWKFNSTDGLYFSNQFNNKISYSENEVFCNLIKTHPDYKELELPIEPKFKVGDRIRWINHDVETQTITDIRDGSYITVDKYGIRCALKFAKQDEWELVPQTPHYDISNFKPFDKVLVRCSNGEEWMIEFYCKYDTLVHTSPHRDYPFMGIGDSYSQCIPFEGNEHLLGTTDMPSEEYINW